VNSSRLYLLLSVMQLAVNATSKMTKTLLLTLLGIRTRLSAESAGLFPSRWTCSAGRPARGKVVRLGRKAASGLAWLFGSKEFSETESEFFAY